MRTSIISLVAISSLGSALNLMVTSSHEILNNEFPVPEASPVAVADLGGAEGSFLELTDTAEEALRWTVLHNKFRCMHDAPMLAWDDCVAGSAQQHANAGSFSHSQSYQLAPCAGPAGENLAMGHSSLEDGTTAWYDEYEQWKMTSGTAGSSGTGHFTAMVWKGVKKLGCGTLKSKRLYVCRYKADETLNSNTPNMSGAYGSMVGRRNSKSEAQCQAEAQAYGLGNGASAPQPTTTRAPAVTTRATTSVTTRAMTLATTTRATTVPSSSGSNCSRSGRYTTGTIMTMNEMTQADYCAMLCSSSSSCSHWSSSASSCTIHSLSGAPVPTLASGWVSGQKSCLSSSTNSPASTTTTSTRASSDALTDCVNPGVNLTGAIYSSLNGVSSTSSCQLWCRLSSRCIAWTLKGSTCSLRSTQGSLQSDYAATSGLRSCTSGFLQLHQQSASNSRLVELESEIPPNDEEIEIDESSLIETTDRGVFDSLKNIFSSSNNGGSNIGQRSDMTEEQKEKLKQSIRASFKDIIKESLTTGTTANGEMVGPVLAPHILEAGVERIFQSVVAEVNSSKQL